MYANVTAEAGGRVLACRLYELTDDPGMKDMLSFLIARDTMHQQQWLAVLEELGGPQALPIPNSFPQEQENSEFAYTYLATGIDGVRSAGGPLVKVGPDRRPWGVPSLQPARPLGEEPVLSSPAAEDTPRPSRSRTGPVRTPQSGNTAIGPEQLGGGMMQKVKDSLS